MRILILGAAGFIGSHLSCYAAEQGHDVVALCRSGKVAGFAGPTFGWALGEPVPESALRGVSCSIHLAHDFNGERGAHLTELATLECIADLRAKGVAKQIFFSSYSAGEHAESLYGRTKLAIERGVKPYPDVTIVRPGLVLGDGGLFGRIRRLSRSAPLIPLPDAGRGLLPVITIERLCRETIMLACSAAPLREANLFEPRLKSLRELVLEAAAEAGRHPWLLSVPSTLVLALLDLADVLHVRLPVNSDNLRGFLANQQASHLSTMQENKL